MQSSGYQVSYKWKSYLTKPTVFVCNEAENSSEKDAFNQYYLIKPDFPHLASQYGFDDWNYPDDCDVMELFNFGGGKINNDGRFVDGDGQSTWCGEKILKEERV